MTLSYGAKYQKTLEEVADPNAFWEAQDGLETLPEPPKVPPTPTIASNGVRNVKEAEVEPPKGWRNSYSSRPLKPRSLQKSSEYLREKSMEEGPSWEEEFDQLFGEVKSIEEEPILESHFYDSRLDFNVSEFREKVNGIKKKLWHAYKSGDMASGTREFEFLTKLQGRVPAAYNGLHAMCKPCWKAMLELCIVHGEYGPLMKLLDRLKAVFGLAEADRALMTLRFLYEHQLIDLAKSFWQDAETANILDERAYADIAVWMQKKGLFFESKKMLHTAFLLSEKQEPNFVATIYLYNAAISWSIKTADIAFLKEIIEKMKSSPPFGISSDTFGSWLQMTNNLIYGPNMMDSLSNTTRNKPDSAELIPTHSVQEYLALQNLLFKTIFDSLGSLGFGVSTLMRQELLRQAIIQAPTIAEQLNAIKEYGQGTLLFSVSCMVDSLIIHRNLDDLHALLKTPSKFFSKRPNGAPLRFPPSLYLGIASWIDRFVERPASAPAAPTGAAFSSKTPQTSPNNQTPTIEMISPLLGEPTMAIRLYETAFFRSLPPPRCLAKFLLHVLSLVEETKSVDSSGTPRSDARQAVLKRQNGKIAIQTVLERLYQKPVLGIPDSADAATPILKELYKLGFVKEGDQFSYYCLQRLSKRHLGVIFAQSMISLEKRADWKAVDDLWVLAKHKEVQKHEFLAKIFARTLNSRTPFNAQAAISFIISLINREITNSVSTHHEAAQLFFRLNHPVFDVPAFWALERYRRTCRLPLTIATASMLATVLCSRGDTFIKTEANVRLHNDFDSFTDSSNHRNMDPLPIDDARTFEDLFDSWYTVFMKAVPASTRSISPLLENGST
jgi:hypothetical protein